MKKDCLPIVNSDVVKKLILRHRKKFLWIFTNWTQQGNIFSSAKLVFAHQCPLVRNQVKKRKVTPTFS